MNRDIERNKKIHNKIVDQYESIHIEIFNDIEQARLFNELQEAKNILKKNSKMVALDLGCGSGNMTKYLLELNYDEVIASDVSTSFLNLVSSRFKTDKLKTVQLNGHNLENIESNSIDFICAYSVLHHIPDYLGIIKEMIRVLKVGGIIYLDHEHNESFFSENKTYENFINEMREAKLPKGFAFYLKPSNYLRFLIGLFDRKIMIKINPKFQREGDIHVFKDDHIIFDEIKKIFKTHYISTIKDEDYLLHKGNYNKDVYDKYKDKISDIKLLIGKKMIDKMDMEACDVSYWNDSKVKV
jgi:ubiquinone/menaquinone biosynthesis C-methylase UbiE